MSAISKSPLKNTWLLHQGRKAIILSPFNPVRESLPGVPMFSWRTPCKWGDHLVHPSLPQRRHQMSRCHSFIGHLKLHKATCPKLFRGPGLTHQLPEKGTYRCKYTRASKNPRNAASALTPILFMADQILSIPLSTVLCLDNEHLQLQAIQSKLQQQQQNPHLLSGTDFCAKS